MATTIWFLSSVWDEAKLSLITLPKRIPIFNHAQSLSPRFVDSGRLFWWGKISGISFLHPSPYCIPALPIRAWKFQRSKINSTILPNDFPKPIFEKKMKKILSMIILWWLILLQAQSVTMTPSVNEKSVTVTNCHSNRIEPSAAVNGAFTSWSLHEVQRTFELMISTPSFHSGPEARSDLGHFTLILSWKWHFLGHFQLIMYWNWPKKCHCIRIFVTITAWKS